MADTIFNHRSPLMPNPDSSEAEMEQLNSLPIPPLDPLLLNQNLDQCNNFVSDLSSNFDDICDFDITFDDLTGLYFPSEDEQFLIPNAIDSDMEQPRLQPDYFDGHFACDDVNSDSPDSSGFGVCGDHGKLEVDKYLNPSPSEAGSCDSVCGSVDRSPISGPVSSHESGNSGSGVLSEGSPVSGTIGNSCNFIVDQNIVKTESESSKNLKNVKVVSTKRKKEMVDGERGEVMRNSKPRKVENEIVCVNVDGTTSLSEEDEKRRARLVRNRESAQLSRQRKKHYVEELEDKVRSLHSTIAELNGKVSYFMAENATLRQQLSGNGVCPQPMYAPMAPYPWVPCAPYVVKSQGSQVPLVPIPRLKPQQAAPAAAKPKKIEGKKGEGKTKKVASVSLLGLLFFILLFGGLVPIVDVKFGGVSENGIGGLSFGSERSYEQHKGRVLIVDGHSNGSLANTSVVFSNSSMHCERSRNGYSECDVSNKGGSEHLPGSDEFGQFGNASEQLVASLYVPRNDKMVKIDGNLIIHSVLASERAVASHESLQVNNTKETALAIPQFGSSSVRHSHVYQTHIDRQKALSSGSAEASKDNPKPSAAKGNLQQWFREGLAGPMLSSGMCTEVFQFDVSPKPGAIVPASPVANMTSKHRQSNSTHLTKRKNRRILHGLPIPLAGSDLNITGKHAGGNSKKEKLEGNNKALSPMVVSVLVDPREAGDGEVDGVITPKSLSRIFVVVLLDSIKYVTYSCGLPTTGLHLVTT